MLQFFYSRGIGGDPIRLNELSSPASRSLFPELTYGLANMASFPTTQIVNALSQHHFVKDAGDLYIKAYGWVVKFAT
jgi:hypothetical protein